MSTSFDAEVQQACEQLAIGYARASDVGDADRAAAYFTEDGQLEMPGGRSFMGRDAIRQRLADQPADQVSRHVLSNISIELRSPDYAVGQSYVTMYRATRTGSAGALPLDGPYLVGQYDDEYRCTPEGWRLARRKLTTIFRRAGA